MGLGPKIPGPQKTWELKPAICQSSRRDYLWPCSTKVTRDCDWRSLRDPSSESSFRIVANSDSTSISLSADAKSASILLSERSRSTKIDSSRQVSDLAQWSLQDFLEFPWSQTMIWQILQDLHNSQRNIVIWPYSFKIWWETPNFSRFLQEFPDFLRFSHFSDELFQRFQESSISSILSAYLQEISKIPALLPLG